MQASFAIYIMDEPEKRNFLFIPSFARTNPSGDHPPGTIAQATRRTHHITGFKFFNLSQLDRSEPPGRADKTQPETYTAQFNLSEPRFTEVARFIGEAVWVDDGTGGIIDEKTLDGFKVAQRDLLGPSQ